MAKAKTPRTPSPRSQKAVKPAAVDPVVEAQKTVEAAPNPVISKADPVAALQKAPIALSPKNGHRPDDLEPEIRARAYQLYLERGSTPGHPQEDWDQAEREIMARRNHQQSA
jgi:hypothetical protein